ncbi:PD-(D/E)XK nuclease-like domain-containing protein [Nocardia cyriacigeorgica]|uniref:PD-(D/E)XK nuclease-like domain-containing protein n=1 Tax=Nocardia cyriacigeorgica TaxID=135487 RepID=UPI002B4B759A|nr:PD-(D/E)XK nuclease-like domain-containing protein [Nocardia cyriacigeorgica]
MCPSISTTATAIRCRRPVRGSYSSCRRTGGDTSRSTRRRSRPTWNGARPCTRSCSASVDTGFDKWQSNDAKARVAEIREAGGIPLRPKDFDAVHQAAENLRNHERVRRWLASGEPELSVYHRDPVTGVMLRARADWVHWIDARTALILDVKKSRAEGPDEFRESVEKFGYDCQQDWYQAAFAAHGITTAFEFGVICSDPPYEPYVVDLSDRYLERAAERNRRAIDIYAACRESGHWPSHGDGDHSNHIQPSRWAYKEDYAA